MSNKQAMKQENLQPGSKMKSAGSSKGKPISTLQKPKANEEMSNQYIYLLTKYANILLNQGDCEKLTKINDTLTKACQRSDTFNILIKSALQIKPKSIKQLASSFFQQDNIWAILEKEIVQNGYAAQLWLYCGGLDNLRERLAQLSTRNDALTEQVNALNRKIENTSLSEDKQEHPIQVSTDLSVEALTADYNKAKRKLQRLEAQMKELQAESGKDKLSNILAAVAPSLGELTQFLRHMDASGFDEDTKVAFRQAVWGIYDAFVEEGAQLIGVIGEEVSYNPLRHFTPAHIAKGTRVMISNPGFQVDDDTIVPAQVEVLEG